MSRFRVGDFVVTKKPIQGRDATLPARSQVAILSTKEGRPGDFYYTVQAPNGEFWARENDLTFPMMEEEC